MRKEIRRSMSKVLTMLVATALITNTTTVFATDNDVRLFEETRAIESADYQSEDNLIVNPSFDNVSNKEGWEFVNGAGIGSNNKHSGKYHFYLDSGNKNEVKQVIKVPYNGYYNASAWISAGGSNGGFEIRNKSTGEVLEKTTIQKQSKYTKYDLSSIYLEKNQEIEIVCYGGNGWVNGDDFELYYDTSIHENLLLNSEFEAGDCWNITNGRIADGIAILEDESSKITQDIKAPIEGSYILNIKVKAISNDVNVKIGDKAFTIDSSDEFKELTFEDIKLSKNQLVDLIINGKAEIERVSFKYDISKLEKTNPEASDVRINGRSDIDSLITGEYIFTDADNHKEGTSRYRWLVSDEINGEYTPLENESNKSLVISKELEDKFIKFEVSPRDQFGAIGTSVLSDPIGPVDLNVLGNPGFELDRNGWSFKGASTVKSEAYEGVSRAIIDAGEGNQLSQKILIPRTSNYNLSAYVKTTGTGSKMEIKNLDDEVIRSFDINPTDGYKKIEIKDIPLESGEEVVVFFTGASDSSVDIDNVSLVRNRDSAIPEFNNIIKFKVDGQVGNTVINKKDREITFKVPYGKDVTKLNVSEIQVSEQALVDVKEGDILDFTFPRELTVTSKSGNQSIWKINCEVQEKQIIATSSNKMLEDSFNWSVNKTDQFVMTGKRGILNKDESRPNGDGTGEVDYIPSYWAGYYDRTAFYGRDFVHQATGGHLAGLEDENFSMFKIFAKNATEARRWYTLWAFNFDGSPHIIDYKNDNTFVKEVPAQFELVEKAYEQYLWSGDKRYINDPDLWNFYTKVMTDYIDLHDKQKPNGIAEGFGGIWQGSCTYNERGEHPIEAGDAIGSQYQATLAYAGMLKARGEKGASEEWYAKAKELKRYFNEEWSVIDENNPEAPYARIIDKNGNKKNDFGKENSWFMPMKLITEPGERNDKYLDYISEKLGDGIGTAPEAPWNIEAYTYIPETYFPYNRNEEAWKWMKYIMSVKDNPHERPSQGTNGDYPEISFTFVSHTVEGLMGVEANAEEHSIVTASHLVDEIDWLDLKYLEMGEHEIDIRHDGLTKTTLTNKADSDLNWEARFYGDHKYINVNGVQYEAKQKDVNGELVSYANVSVKSNETISAEATNEVIEIANKDKLITDITTAEGLNSKDYTEESWNKFSQALAAAKEIASNEKATQKEVDEAVKNLNKAIDELEKKVEEKVDKTDLNNKIKDAEKLNSKDYTEKSWNKFSQALAVAKGVASNAKATQKEIDKALEELEIAIKALEKKENTEVKVDKAALLVKIEEAEKLNRNDYTESTWKRFSEALENAKKVIDDEKVTQKDVDKALRTLEKAMKDLVKKGQLPNTGAVVGTTSILTLAGVLIASGYKIRKKRK